MSKRPFLLCFAALTLTLPSLASPIQYVINFSLDSGGPLPSSGGFTYDSVSKTFSDFEVVWKSVTFDMTARANAGPQFGVTPGSCGLASDASGSFQILSGAPCVRGWNAASLFGGADFTFFADQFLVGTAYLRLLQVPDPSRTNAFADGSFSIAAVPEPSAGVLFAVGFAALAGVYS
ncbi:MAG: hypothetical protein IT168_05860 [Bryobacterales bacterium]|nr:hypothetical protein [Bryobacterales bacterium]